jgi:heptosyltransferase-2
MQILVIRFRYLGDTVLTVPFLRNLRRAEPNARIVWMVAPGDAEVVKGIPYVDEFLVWDPRKGSDGRPGAHRTLAARIGFVRELRRRRFDKVYVLKRSFSSALMAFLSGAPRRVGFDTEGRGFLLTRRAPYLAGRHEVESFLDVLRADGIPTPDNHLEAWLSPDERAFAADFLERAGFKPGEPIVGLHPFCANPPRGWHEDEFVAVANEVQRRYGARILIFGGKQDQDLAEKMRQGITPAAVSLAGRTNLRESMALLARCTAFVCNDSGVMHLGAALGVPLVALFGPQSPAKFGPWTKNARIIYLSFPCSPCRQKFFTECTPSARGKPACMEAITVREVLEAIDSLGVFPAAGC